MADLFTDTSLYSTKTIEQILEENKLLNEQKNNMDYFGRLISHMTYLQKKGQDIDLKAIEGYKKQFEESKSRYDYHFKRIEYLQSTKPTIK